MKIAIFSDNFYPELSGITDSIILLGQQLAKNGHKVVFVVPKYSKKDYQKIGLKKEEPELGENISIKRLFSIKYFHSPTKQGRIVIPTGKGIKLMKEFAPDIIHTNTPFGTGREAWQAAKILNIPIVGTSHTPHSEFMKYGLSGPINTKWVQEKILRNFASYYNNCSFVSAPCNSLFEEMIKYGFNKPHEKLSNPIYLKDFYPVSSQKEKNDLKKVFNFSRKTIVYTGRLAEEKKVDVIIRAFKIVSERIPDTNLAIAGHGEAQSGLKKISEELLISKKVDFLGYVENKKMPLLYKASDLFVIMSVAESQSLSLMQAMSSGIPSIGANARALPEYINKESGVIVEPGDTKKLAEEMIKILSDDNLAEKLGQGGIDTSKICDPQRISEEWEKIYNEAIINYRAKRNS